MASGAHLEHACLWKGREAEGYPLSVLISPNPLWVFHSPSSYDYRVTPSAACFFIIWPCVLLDDLNPLKLVQSRLLRNRSPTHRRNGWIWMPSFVPMNISMEYSCGPVCRQDSIRETKWNRNNVTRWSVSGTAEYAMCCHRALSLKRPQRRRETSHWSAEQAVIGRSYTSPPLVIVLGKPQMPKTFFELLFFRKICKPHKLFCYGPICSFGGTSLKEKRYYFEFGFFFPLLSNKECN